MRYPAIRSPNNIFSHDDSGGSPLSSALSELLRHIHSNSGESRHRTPIRRRARVSSSSTYVPRFERLERRRRMAAKVTENIVCSMVQGHGEGQVQQQFSDYPLTFDLISSDGGDHSYDYSISNLLYNDDSVYSSVKKNNVNILLKFNPSPNKMVDSICVITEVSAKSPSINFSAPCTDILLFISHTAINIEDMMKYDDFTYSEFERSQLNPEKYPWPLPELVPVTYLQLTMESSYCQTVSIPCRSGKYIGLKLLKSGGTGDNLDIQKFSIKGFIGPRMFSEADMA